MTPITKEGLSDADRARPNHVDALRTGDNHVRDVAGADDDDFLHSSGDLGEAAAAFRN